MPGFATNTSCIKGIKSTYKAKEGSKGCRMRGMTKYQEAEREASRTKKALESESGAGPAEERSTKRTRQAVFKYTQASTSESKPSRKKTRKGSEVVASAQVLEINPYGTKEQEEEKEELAQALCPWSLGSRGPAISAKAEPAVESATAEGHVEAATTTP